MFSGAFCISQNIVHIHTRIWVAYRGRILGRNPDKVFLYSFARDFYLSNSRSILQFKMYIVKEKGEKPDRKL